MIVDQFMTKNVITTTEDTLIVDALNIMEENDFNRLPIVRDGKLVGMLTERIVLDVSRNPVTGKDIHSMIYLLTKARVSEMMKKNIPTIHKEMQLEEAALTMQRKNVLALPVVDEENHVIGIITYKDVFRAFIQMTGYNDPGSRLVVEIPEDDPSILQDITNILAEADVRVTHIFVSEREEFSEITIQVNTPKVDEVEELLRYQGYTVLRAKENPVE